MAIINSYSTQLNQVGGQFLLWHIYEFDTGVDSLRMDRGLQSAGFDVDADRVAQEPKALEHEEVTRVEELAQDGFWHPTDNPTPTWNKSFRVGAVGKVIVADATHINERFNGVTPWDGQHIQFQLIWEDPLLDGRSAQEIADALGITRDDVILLKNHYNLIEDAVNRQKYNEIQDSVIQIQAIEFGFTI